MPASNNTPAPAPVDLVAIAIAAGEVAKKTGASEAKTKRHGYGVFEHRTTGAFAILTYTEGGKPLDWVLVGRNRTSQLGRGKRMKDVWALHDKLVAAGKLRPISAPQPAPASEAASEAKAETEVKGEEKAGATA